MALHNPGGDAKPIFKYDAKQGVGKIDDDIVPLKNFKAIFDLDALELGYCRFGENTMPEWRMAPAADEAAVKAIQRPEIFGADGKPAFKWGFRLHLKLTQKLAGNSTAVREFASNSFVTFNGLNQLHDDWLSQRGDHPGQLPIVAGKSTIAIPGAHGKNHQPVFEIVGWVDPPRDLVAMRNGAVPKKPVAPAASASAPQTTDNEPDPVDFSEDDGDDF